MRSIISSKKKFRKLIREMVKKVLKEDFNSASGKNYDDLEKDGVSYNPPFEEMKKETVVIEDLDFKSVSNWERFQDVFDVVDPMETRDSNYTDEYKFRSTVYFKETSLVDAEFQVRVYFEETPGFLTNIEGKKYDPDYTSEYDGYAGNTLIKGPEFIIEKLLEWIRNNTHYSSYFEK